ncbi:EamA family transporter [Xanthobacter versatilis]|uniref:EamA family transporter n=1 Tax=Xanthobacter autotrophicus (strain ATCC BAA-1158 / Py2) TaxID=78245 RepID=UPI003728A2C4
MNASLVALFATSVACDVAGQLAFKRGADRLPAVGSAGVGRFALRLVGEPWLILGLLVYAVEFLVWTRILAQVPLAIAFPVASLNILGITVASHLWLGERIVPRQYAGAVLVTAGVALVASSL